MKRRNKMASVSDTCSNQEPIGIINGNRLRSERNSAREVFPFPVENQTVFSNPPCFIWLPDEELSSYTVNVTKDGAQYFEVTTDKNYCLPDKIFEAGEYEWNVVSGGREKGWVRFRVSPQAMIFDPPSAEELFDSVPDVHPRTLFFKEDIPAILNEKKSELETLKRNAGLAYENGMFEYPKFHLDGKALPYREYFGKYRDFCDRNMVATALLYALTGDMRAGQHSKSLFMRICSMTPNGPASIVGKYGDEVGLSNARTLPTVYDLIFPLFSEAEKDLAEWTVYCYGLQCEYRLRRLDYCHNPGDSHAGRLPAYLAECAMILRYGKVADKETLMRWLGYATEIYSGIFPYYGGSDGGWAEGAFYCTSYTRWYLPFFCMAERFTGKSFFGKPFYRNLIKYIVHFANPEYELHPFGDGYWCKSTDEEWPGFFCQNPYRVYAEMFGDEYARELSRKYAAPDYYRLHLLDIFMKLPSGKEKPEAVPVNDMELFADTGFISNHTDLKNMGKDFALQIRASRFGSDSHRHADQCSFALFYAGKALISPSGYFGRQYGSKHHFGWLCTTKAHNALLFNGKGQYERSHKTVGKINACFRDGNVFYAETEAGDAYPVEVKWLRKFRMTENELVITDEVASEEPVSVIYPLHSVKPFSITGNEAEIENGVKLHIKMTSEQPIKCSTTDRYDVDLNEGEPEEYHVKMPAQYHLYYEFAKSKKHTIECRYTIKMI